VRSGIRTVGARQHAAWLVDPNGTAAASLAVRQDGAQVCVSLAATEQRYAVVRVQSGTEGVDAPQPIDVHVWLEGGHHRVAGLERLQDGRLPWPR
jgi:hypothetical protein